MPAEKLVGSLFNFSISGQTKEDGVRRLESDIAIRFSQDPLLNCFETASTVSVRLPNDKSKTTFQSINHVDVVLAGS
jgi:hypothetical protein